MGELIDAYLSVWTAWGHAYMSLAHWVYEWHTWLAAWGVFVTLMVTPLLVNTMFGPRGKQCLTQSYQLRYGTSISTNEPRTGATGTPEAHT